MIRPSIASSLLADRSPPPHHAGMAERSGSPPRTATLRPASVHANALRQTVRPKGTDHRLLIMIKPTDADSIPVIDLFAGPGGLGEGFAALGRPQGKPCFAIGLSIEKDPIAHQTLQLRAFFRQFP